MADGYLSKSWLKNFPCKSILLQCSFLSSEMNRMQFLNICQNAWSLILHSDLSLKFDCIQDGWELNADRMIHVAPNLDDSHWRLLIVHHENFIPVVFETSLLTYLWWFYLTWFFFVFFFYGFRMFQFFQYVDQCLAYCLSKLTKEGFMLQFLQEHFRGETNISKVPGASNGALTIPACF